MNRYLREINLGRLRRGYRTKVNEAPPIGTSQGLFHLTETMPAYAGSYLHQWDSPVHTHSFVEIAFAIGGTAIHHSLAGRREMRPGDVLLLRPGCLARVRGLPAVRGVQLLLQQRAAAPRAGLDP